MRKSTSLFFWYLPFFVFLFFSATAFASAPVISSVRVENIMGPGAQVKWNTDQAANSRVFFGTTSGSDTYTIFSDSRCDSGGYVTEHCVNLTGLSSSTAYYYKVESMNAAYEDTHSGEYTFTSSSSGSSGGSSGSGGSGSTGGSGSSGSVSTVSVPNAPAGLTATVAPSGDAVGLLWVDASTNELDFQVFRKISGGAWEHKKTLAENSTVYSDVSVLPGTYEYQVFACNSYGCSAGSNSVSATLGIATTSSSGLGTSGSSSTSTSPSMDSSGGDTTPPVISNISVENIMGSGAQVKWKTDDSADSKVFFGTVPGSYPSASDWRCDSGGYVTEHCINLTGLSPSIAYYYKVESKNQAGLSAESIQYSFVSAAGTYYMTSTTSSYLYSSTTSYSYISTTTGISSDSPSSALVYGTLSVGVKDAAGNPVLKAYVYASKKDYLYSASRETDSGGMATFSVPEGNYWIGVYPPSGRNDLVRPEQVEVVVSATAMKAVLIQFKSAVKKITGTVLFEDGKPASEAAEVGAYQSESGQWVSAFTDSSGRYTLGVGGGTWKVGVRPVNPLTARWSWNGIFQDVSFGGSSAEEIKTVNFTVLPKNAVVVAVALNEAGTPIVGAGVILDSLSLVSSQTPRPPYEYRTTDSSGRASFNVGSGTYYLRASPPSSGDYSDIAEVMASVSSGGSQEVKIVFKKRTAETTIELRGMARRDDGTPIGAFVWAWSEDGRTVEVRAAANGAFTLLALPNSRWHIGAGWETDGVPYRAKEIVLSVSASPLLFELVLEKIDRAELPPPVSVSQSSSAQIVVQTQDGARVTIPPSSSSVSGTLAVAVEPTVEAPSQPLARVIGTAYDITVRDASGKNITTFSKEIEIILPYSDAELKDQGIAESTVSPSYYDEKTGLWVRVDDFTVDTKSNVVIARVRHLTRFAIVAAADIVPPPVPIDVAGSALGSGKVRLTWKNPTNDFDHAKIYRSESAGALGKILISEVKGQAYMDEDVVNAVLYFYTIRAVDPAGNETSNMNQVSVRAIGTSQKSATGTPPVIPPGSATKLAILRTLVQGMRGNDIKTIQELLKKERVYPEGLITGYFGSLTKRAVVRFQEKYTTVILAPIGRTKGTGIVGPATRKKMNELLA